MRVCSPEYSHRRACEKTHIRSAQPGTTFHPVQQMVGNMLAKIETLRDISRRCQATLPLSSEQQQWLSKVLNDFLAHRSRTIDEAMGLRFPRGGVPWWREQAIRLRDAALRELVARFYSAFAVSNQARRTHTLAIRYGASAWRFDKQLDELPERYVGTPQEWLWRAFASGAPMPIGERRLREILSRRSGVLTRCSARPKSQQSIAAFAGLRTRA